MTTEDRHRAAASALAAAARDRVPIAPLSETWPGFDVDDAYAVQTLFVAGRAEAGARTVGWKVGLTSLAMQRQLGVDQPDFGPLLDDMEISTGGEVPAASLIAPRIEGEIAFRLGSGLEGPGVDRDGAAEAVEVVLGALEVIDSRIADWRIALPDTIADHASCARFVLGESGVPLDRLDLPSVELVLTVDGDEAGRGTGSAILGDPLLALAWLANTLGAYGRELRAGDVILAGAVHAAVPLRAGTHVRAAFSDPAIEAVSVRCV